MLPIDVKLSPTLTPLQSGILKVFTAREPGIDPNKVMPMYSKGVLANEGLLGDATLIAVSEQLSTQLNHAKTLMNQLGVKDINEAPAITVSSPLKVVPGVLRPNPGFTPNSVLPVNSSVIIASTLDLTNTTLTIQPSVSTLTIIVNTLTCGQGAKITYDDSTVWRPSPLPVTTAANGTSFNPNAYGGGATNGPNGGNGGNGAAGAPQTIAPPAAPNVTIYALNINGMPAVDLQGLKGAQGNPGQNGGNGGNGGRGKNGSDAWPFGCTSQPGSGGAGGHGGNGGNGGEGGQGGSFFIATTQANWQALLAQTWTINNAGGPGGDPGLPGTGGVGGEGGQPGTPGGAGMCNHLPQAANGARGGNGNSGGDGPAGNGGTITPAIITQAEWEEELTLPWLQTINPSIGFPGTPVTGVGLNFGSGDTVLVNGQSIAATFPAAGQFKITLPTTLAGGPNSISVRRAADGAASDSMTFTVQPFITGSSAGGGFTPGDIITLNGAGFLTNASVHLTQPSQAMQLLVPSSVTATAITFQVPHVTSATSVAQGTASLVVVNPDGLSSNTLQLTRLSFVANGFLPSVNGFAFTNSSACPGSPSLSTFASDFGTAEVAASFLFDPVMTSAYYGLYALLLGPECHGLCTGFACGAMDRFTNGITNLFGQFAAVTPDLKNELTIDWGRQLSGELLISFLGQCFNGQAQIQTTVEQIENTFSGTPTRADMPLLYLLPSGLPVSSQWVNNLENSHTLVPYKLVRPSGWTSGFNNVKLFLYDCNSPGSDDCFLTLTQSGSTVSFNYGSTGTAFYSPAYSSANGFTLGVQTMQSALYNSVNLPWLAGAGYVVDFLLSPATLAVSNLAGQTTGTRGSNLVGEVPGVVPSLFNFSHNLVMIPRQLALQRTIQGTGNGTYTYASIAPPNPATPASAYSPLLPASANAVIPHERGFTLHNVSCTGSTKDVVLLGPDNQSIQLSSSDTGKTFDVLIAQHYEVQTGAAPHVESTHQVQLIELSGLSLNPGEQLLLWTDTAIGQVGVSNSGAAKNFNATISAVDAATGKATATHQLAGAVAANSDFKITIPDWKLATAPTTQRGSLKSFLPAGFQAPTVK